MSGCAADDSAPDGASDGRPDGESLQIGLAYSPGGRGDKSFNDAAYEGMKAAVAEYGGEFQEVSPRPDGSDAAQVLANLADQGFNPIVAVGFEYSDVIGDVVAQYPDVTFAQVDGPVADAGDPSNLTGLLFSEEQGSFLAGVAAALKSKTDHVGFIGGVEIPLIGKFEAGFAAGVAAVNPNATLDVKYLSPAGDYSGFSDPAKGKVVAQGMYESGADIVYHAAGGSGQGVFEAAAATGNLAIGVDSDQYQTVGDPKLQAVILTSMQKRVDVAVGDFIGDYLDGFVQGGTDIRNDLSNDGVSLATSGGQIDNIADEISSYKERIVSGEIKVPTTP
jgi:basic membrane protein A